MNDIIFLIRVKLPQKKIFNKTIATKNSELTTFLYTQPCILQLYRVTAQGALPVQQSQR